jgi:hypothetical protein
MAPAIAFTRQRDEPVGQRSRDTHVGVVSLLAEMVEVAAFGGCRSAFTPPGVV